MEEHQRICDISVAWRGKKFAVKMSPTATLKELGDEMQKLTNVKADTMRFIVPQLSTKSSNLLIPFSNEHERVKLQETSIIEGKPVRMMGVSENEVEEILQGEKLNLRIAGFDEEEKRLQKRISNGPQFSLKLPQGPYTFGDFRTLQLPGIVLNPPASVALKIMHTLAADPGIVAIMNKHRWSVGIMTEMAPVGYVGISPKCILGFNKNQGEEISLRLRTDDLKGFRKYASIKKTLLHELAHMVYSEHDANFHALDKQLNEEVNSLDWTRSMGHTLSGFRSSEYDDEEFYVGEGNTVSQKLGGNTSQQLASARMASVAAAYQRMETAPSITSNVSEEPDPDDSELHAYEDPAQLDHLVKEKLEADCFNEVDKKHYEEPDPDDVSDCLNKSEPDPDEVQEEKTQEFENFQPGSRGTCEAPTSNVVTTPFPDTDGNSDTLRSCEGLKPFLSEKRRILDGNTGPQKRIDEPDPDELVAEQNILEYGTISIPSKENSSSLEVDNQLHLSKGYEKSDFRESLEDGVMQSDHLPDHNSTNTADDSRMQIDEPDPDEELRRIQDPVTVACGRLRKAIELLRADIGPAQAIAVLQTLIKIISNVIEHPNEVKFRKLRKANPVIQRTIANHKAAMELVVLIGFNEELVSDEKGKAETYLVLKRNDPGFLWLAKSCIETYIVP